MLLSICLILSIYQELIMWSYLLWFGSRQMSWPMELKGQSAGEVLGKVSLTQKENNKQQARTDTSMQCPSSLDVVWQLWCLELQPLGTMKRGNTNTSEWKGEWTQVLVIILPAKQSRLLSVLSCLLLVKLFVSAAWSKMLSYGLLM